MKLPHLATVLLTTAFGLLACERKVVVVEVPPPTPTEAPLARTKTAETSRLGEAIDTFEREPTATNHAGVKQALADLDGEIAELEALVAKRGGSEREEAAVKLKNLQAYRTGEVTRFTAAQAGAPLARPASRDARTGAEKLEESVRRAGDTAQDAARKTGDGIKDAAR